MTNNRISLAAAALFFFCIALLLIYLLRVRLYAPLPNAVFWFSTYTAILAIVFQITRIPWRGHEGFLVAEILILGIALHLGFQITIYGLCDSDSYRIIEMVREILEHGRLVGTPPGVYIPLQKIHGAALNYITGISMFSIAKWFSSIISTFFVLVLYVLVKKVFRSEKLALLTILLMVTLQFFEFFGSTYHHSIFALVPAMTMLFFLTKAKGGNRIKFSALAILCLFAVILSHHVISLIMLLFLLVHLAVRPFSGSVHGNYLLTSKQAVLRVTAGFTLIAFVGLFFHWMYIYMDPLVVLVKWGQALLTPDPGVAETFSQEVPAFNLQMIETLMGRIIFFGTYIFHAIFALILLYRVFSQPSDRYPEFYSFTAFLALCAVISVVQMFVIPRETAILSMTRFYMLGWIFGFAPLTACVLEKKPRWGEKAGIGLLAAFMLFNIYMTPPGIYDLNFPGREEGNVALREDHALAETLVFTGKVAAYQKTSLAINYVQGFLPQNLLTVPSIGQLEQLDYIVIKKGELERYIERGSYVFPEYEYSSDVVNRLAGLSTGDNSTGRDRIYDSKNLVVVK